MPKIMINLKNRRPLSKLSHWTKYFIHTPQPRARIRKLPLHDYVTHVVKIDILTGHEEIANMYFILKIIFRCIFIRKKTKKKKTVSRNLYSSLWKYNILSNKILLKYLFPKP